MSKKVHSLRASDETWERLEKKAERLGFDSIGKMLEAESKLEDLKTRIARRQRNIHESCQRYVIDEYTKQVARERGLTILEAGHYIIQNISDRIIYNLTKKIIAMELNYLQLHGVTTLSEDTPEFKTEDNWCPHCDTEFPSATALKKHVKAEHPDQFDAMYKSGKKVLT